MDKRLIVLLLLIPFLMGAAPSRSFTYVSGTTIDPDEVTQNEDNIYLYLQAGVDTYKPASIIGSYLADNISITSSGDMTFSGITDLTGIFQLDGSTVTATASEINIVSGITASTAEINLLDGVPATLTTTEIGYLDGVSSAIQTQLDGKSATTGNSSIATVGTIITGTWQATDVGISYGGTGASSAGAALTNLGGAALGANSDITSLSALSTPLSVAQGGTGQANLTDLIALTTNTTGNYVATITNGTGITGASSGEGKALTLSATLGTSVDLTSEVSGTLPVANGGTNQTTTGLAFGGKIIAYTGNGTDDRNIAHGLGRTPIKVLITGTTIDTIAPILWVTGMAATYARLLTNGTMAQNEIQSVDGTNVQIGTSVNVNNDTKTYTMFVR